MGVVSIDKLHGRPRDLKFAFRKGAGTEELSKKQGKVNS